MATKQQTIVKKTEIIEEVKVTAKTTPKKEKAETEKPLKKAATKKAVPKKAAAKKTPTKKATAADTVVQLTETVKVNFQVRFKTVNGQNLFLTGSHSLLGNNDLLQAVPMQYFNEDFWFVEIEFPIDSKNELPFQYNYVLKNEDGSIVVDWGKDKTLSIGSKSPSEIVLIDTWNHAGYYENTFYADAFQEVLLKNNFTELDIKAPKIVTHTFKVKSPLLAKGQVICLIGSDKLLNQWDTTSPILLSRPAGAEQFEVSLNLSKASFPISYKYGVYDIDNKKWVGFENGNNRVLFDVVSKDKKTIINDGYTYLPNNTWKGAGVAIPVFSLRSEASFGVGDFADLKNLADWASQVGLKMIQVLPINDTIATNTFKDSYPYASISAFALHPMYLNIPNLAGAKYKKQLKKWEGEGAKLNALPVVDYDAVVKLKIQIIKEIYKNEGDEAIASPAFNNFFNQNKEWLTAYAVFCYLRDEYGVVDFNKWPAYKHFNVADIESLVDPSSAAYHDIALHYFIQYHLHIQLKDAAAYAHSKGIILKGDIAIGVYRHSADTWQNPELFHMEYQAGAPPDDFAIKGQNWGFPTYNWQKMQEDGFTWWKQRFEQMSHYFDAFRIDHILGFFRIWSIPIHAVEGIMGHFVPALAIHIHEFNQQGIWFDYHRYTQPFINESILWEYFGYDNELVKSLFLLKNDDGTYRLKPAFATQRLVEAHFATLESDEQHQKIKQGLYNLISNIILFDANGDGQYFHFRFGMESTTSFKFLSDDTKQQLKNSYVNYFFKRQDDFWKQEALQKLPALKRVTNMIVCGEDLGLVPACVPDVMQQLGLLSLEIQRMPKDSSKQFFHPNDAPYLSVVTPSTHDMSTIRGWWEADKSSIQHFYNHELGQWGDAPFYCEAWINKAIVVQHLYSPAMWSIFQLQDLMGINELVRRDNPKEEQINVPADPNHYWQYRMHMSIEDLQKASSFIDELADFIKASGR